MTAGSLIASLVALLVVAGGCSVKMMRAAESGDLPRTIAWGFTLTFVAIAASGLAR